MKLRDEVKIYQNDFGPVALNKQLLRPAKGGSKQEEYQFNVKIDGSNLRIRGREIEIPNYCLPEIDTIPLI